MNLDVYGFHEQPFRMTPDVRLFFPSTAHSRAYAHLLYGLSQREGFVVVTGEVGAGKTTLIERLCAEFSTKGHAIARVMTTQVEAGGTAAPRRHRLRRPGRGRQSGAAAAESSPRCAAALPKGAGGRSSSWTRRRPCRSPRSRSCACFPT